MSPSEERLRAAVESSPSGLLMTDERGIIVLSNREVERLFGYMPGELLGLSIDALVPNRARAAHGAQRAVFLAESRPRAMGAGRDLRGRRKDGSEVPIEVGLTPVTTSEGRFVLASVVDISARRRSELERRDLEQQLRQAQKVEAIGRLAAGIAHDFNHVLGAIVGFTELARGATSIDECRADLDEVLRAADRGRLFVERLLRFSRREEFVLQPVDLGGAVEETTDLIRSVLPANVEIRTSIAPGCLPALADPASVHQVVMNLATNAAHAMGDAGGVLELAVKPLYVRDSIAREHPVLSEGPHVMLRVGDTGTGMDEATRARVFEPFFTTKPQGQGTGLGLPVVHSIIQDHGGAIWIDSAPGQGTTVTCLFPAADTEVEGAAAGADLLPMGRGERVLCLDDDPRLAAACARLLIRLGYRGVPSSDPVAAVALIEDDPSAFDAVLTDYSMAQLDGLAFASRASAASPTLRVALLSGGPGGFAPSTLRRAGIRAVVHKPASLQALAETLHDLLHPA